MNTQVLADFSLSIISDDCDGKETSNCLQVEILTRKGSEPVFEYQLEPNYGEPWSMAYGKRATMAVMSPDTV